LFDSRAGSISLGDSKIDTEALEELSKGFTVRATNIERLGTVKVAENVVENGASRRTVLLITDYGGHNRINGYEGVVELIRRETWAGQ
jgi:hypothetical protein